MRNGFDELTDTNAVDKGVSVIANAVLVVIRAMLSDLRSCCASRKRNVNSWIVWYNVGDVVVASSEGDGRHDASKVTKILGTGDRSCIGVNFLLKTDDAGMIGLLRERRKLGVGHVFLGDGSHDDREKTRAEETLKDRGAPRRRWVCEATEA